MGVWGQGWRRGIGACVAPWLALACVQNNPDFHGDTDDETGASSDGADAPGSTSERPGTEGGRDGGSTGAGGGEGTGVSACPGEGLCLEEVPLLSGYDAFDVAVTDFDDDGVPDVLLGFEGGALVVYGDGQGNVAQLRVLDMGLIARRVLAFDVDQDGQTDALYSAMPDNTIVMHQGLSGRTFGAENPFDAPTDPLGLAVLDVDGDGINDLATALQSANVVGWRIGDGAGGYAAQQTLAVEAPGEVLARDLTGDGRGDLVIVHGGADPAASGVTVAVAQAGDWATRELLAGTEPVAACFLDFNGDAIPDLAVATAAGPRVELLAGAPDGTFEEGPRTGLEDVPTDIAAGDLDADGTPDLVVTHVGTMLSTLRGRDDGAYDSSLEALTLRAVAVATGDLDVDGRDDVVLATAQYPEGGITVLMSR